MPPPPHPSSPSATTTATIIATSTTSVSAKHPPPIDLTASSPPASQSSQTSPSRVTTNGNSFWQQKKQQGYGVVTPPAAKRRKVAGVVGGIGGTGIGGGGGIGGGKTPASGRKRQLKLGAFVVAGGTPSAGNTTNTTNTANTTSLVNPKTPQPQPQPPSTIKKSAPTSTSTPLTTPNPWSTRKPLPTPTSGSFSSSKPKPKTPTNASILRFFKPVTSEKTATESVRKRSGKDDALFIAHGGYGLDVSDPEDADEGDDGVMEMWVARDGEEKVVEERQGEKESVERGRLELEVVRGRRVVELEDDDEEGMGNGGRGEKREVGEAGEVKPMFNGLKLNLDLGKSIFGGVAVERKSDGGGREKGGDMEEKSTAERDLDSDVDMDGPTGSQEAGNKMSGLSMEYEEDGNDENVSEPAPPVFKLPRKISHHQISKANTDLFHEAEDDDITSTFISQPPEGNGNIEPDEVEDFPDDESSEMGFEEQESLFGFDPAARAIERGFSQVFDDDTPPDNMLTDEIEFTQDEPGGTRSHTMCPICGIELSSLGPADRNAHVNGCLDTETSTLPPATVLVPSTAPPPPIQGSIGQSGWFMKPPGLKTSTLFDSTPASSSKPVSAFAKLMSTNAEAQAWASTAKEQAEQHGMRASERTCPFYKILFNGPITVDAFRYGAVPGCQAYFLSHFHSDHYVGLTSKWDHGPIYCSPVTANLVRLRLKVDPKFVHELPWEEWFEIPHVSGIRVNGIDANHCPGSMLFLFEKNFSGKKPTRILHCGDFRASPEHLTHQLLRPPNKIDTIYLDTTYLNPKYAFPSQSSVITACGHLCTKLNSTSLSTLTNRPSKPRLLILVGTYSIGKERICLGLAQSLNTLIYAPASKLPTLHALNLPSLTALLTPDPALAQVHMIPLQQLDTPSLAEYLSRHPTFTHIVGFRPSGWSYKPPTARAKEPRVEDVLWGREWRSGYSVEEMVPVKGATERARLYAVPYSEHSSFRELTMFMCALEIGKVVPTVNVGSEKSRGAMRKWIEKWERQRGRKRFAVGEDGGVW